MNLFFPKSFRLLTKADYSYLMTDNKVVRSRTFMFFFKPNQVEHARLGLSVSRKVGNSVSRNLIKRMSREYFRHSSVKNYHFDLHMVARVPAGKLNKEELKKNIIHIFSLLDHELSK